MINGTNVLMGTIAITKNVKSLPVQPMAIVELDLHAIMGIATHFNMLSLEDTVINGPLAQTTNNVSKIDVLPFYVGIGINVPKEWSVKEIIAFSSLQFANKLLNVLADQAIIVIEENAAHLQEHIRSHAGLETHHPYEPIDSRYYFYI